MTASAEQRPTDWGCDRSRHQRLLKVAYAPPVHMIDRRVSNGDQVSRVAALVMITGYWQPHHSG